MPGDDWNKAANLRSLLAYMWAHPGKQLLFMGGEIGQEREWSESRSLDWGLLDNPLHAGVQSLIGDLNRAYRELPALYTGDTTPDGFSWIDANDASGNVFSFLRIGSDGSQLVCVANFSGQPHENYRIGLPVSGRWRELINTDSTGYHGSGVGNLGAVTATDEAWHGRPASAVLRLPPAGVLWLVPEQPSAGSDAASSAAPSTVSNPVSSAAPDAVEASRSTVSADSAGSPASAETAGSTPTSSARALPEQRSGLPD
jgi:1,4-alpha-glucan branching enzyme